MLCTKCETNHAGSIGICEECLDEGIQRGIALAHTDGKDDSTQEEIKDGLGSYNPDPVLFKPFYSDPIIRAAADADIQRRKRQDKIVPLITKEDVTNSPICDADPPLDEKEFGYVARGARSLALFLYRERTQIMKAVPNIPNWDEACALAPAIVIEEEQIAA